MILQAVLSILLIASASAHDYSICDAYSLLESTTTCGPTGYALNFGLPICKSFVDNRSLFNTKGKAFLDCARPCLANYVSANITGAITDCTAIKDAAFASHVPCYQQCGFCQVAFSNLGAFSKTFKASDLFSEDANGQVLQIASSCIGK
ncbi:hypothetical protein PRIPAC_79727 [Pristionchus pacificus]|uniref:Uncharacterized protein n=1 Tax=Pristionchus pacificus TaxID=54126 RepID=A0A454XVE6_PRIPA|nr:hypothetical protein PRIPAC_79727 [Pristionchus pacificus]|eukprot:PDM65534.1 hypothetical protein PRIPAC_52476 [Pristionchus pacificus]